MIVYWIVIALLAAFANLSAAALAILYYRSNFAYVTLSVQLVLIISAGYESSSISFFGGDEGALGCMTYSLSYEGGTKS